MENLIHRSPEAVVHPKSGVCKDIIKGPLVPLPPNYHISKKCTFQRTGVVPKAGDAAGSLQQFSPELLAELLRGEHAESPGCSVFLHKQVVAIRLYEMTWGNIFYNLSYSITRPDNGRSTAEATQLNSTLGIEVEIVSG